MDVPSRADLDRATGSPCSGRPGGGGRRRGRPAGARAGREPLCLRGDREALPTPRLRHGRAHRAAPRRGRRRGPGGVPARPPGPATASTSPGPFGPWICRIAANLAVNHVRSPQSREEALPEAHAETPVPGGSPLAGVLDEEARRELARALESLSSDQRAVFVLRVFEELSYKEIAEALEISIGTVMSRLSRGRERLREALTPYLGRGDGAPGGRSGAVSEPPGRAALRAASTASCPRPIAPRRRPTSGSARPARASWRSWPPSTPWPASCRWRRPPDTSTRCPAGCGHASARAGSRASPRPRCGRRRRRRWSCSPW